jgi:hypothetical protein
MENILRSRWLPAALALGLVLVAGFMTYKVYHRTEKQKPGDFRHFYFAGDAINRGADIYESGDRGYIYPPLFAVVISPLARLDPTSAERAWAVINGLLIAGILAIAFADAARRFELPADLRTSLGLVLVALLLTVEQVRWELEMGQTDTLVLLGFTLALFWLDRRPVLAGIALGLAANIKYQSLITIPYLLLRRRYRAAMATAGSTVAWALAPALMVGWDRNLQYLGTAFRGLARLVGIAPAGQAADLNPLTWEASVSLPSAAARHLGGLPGAPLLIVGALMLVAIVVVADYWTVFGRCGVPLLRGRGGQAELASPLRAVVAPEWYGLIVAVLVFSPQSMVRHSFLLLSLNVLIAALLLAPRVGVWRWPLVVGVAVFQLGTKLPPGEDMFDEVLAIWRSYGGASWSMLLMYASVLWVGLRYATAMAEGRPLVYPALRPSTTTSVEHVP